MRSAHDCAEGGLAVTLAECCFDTGGSAPTSTCRTVASHGAARLTSRRSLASRRRASIVSVAPARCSTRCWLAPRPRACRHGRSGATGGNRIRIASMAQLAVDVAVADAEQAWTTAIEAILRADA